MSDRAVGYCCMSPALMDAPVLVGLTSDGLRAPVRVADSVTQTRQGPRGCYQEIPLAIGADSVGVRSRFTIDQRVPPKEKSESRNRCVSLPSES